MTNIIKVKFLKDELPQGKDYSYLVPPDVSVQVGDRVAITEEKRGIVTQVNVPVEEVAAYVDKLKTIVGLAPVKEPEDADSVF